MDVAQKTTPTTTAKYGAGVLYFTIAVAMGFINKAALREFPFSNTLLLLQMILTIVILQVGNGTGVVVLKPFCVQKARVMLPLALFYNANVAFALAGLQRMNIPMYQTLKRLTPCVICIIHGLTGRGWAPQRILYTVAVITCGSIVAGVGDFNFDPWAYAYAITSCLLQAGYLLLAEAGAERGFTSTELLLYNSVLSIPLLVLVVMFTEMDQSIPKLSESAASASFLALLFFASFMGSTLNYALFLCTSLNTALTTTIIGVMKAVAMTSLGFVLLGGAPIAPLNFTGILINTLGGVWYSYEKYHAKSDKRAQEPVEEEEAVEKV